MIDTTRDADLNLERAEKIRVWIFVTIYCHYAVRRIQEGEDSICSKLQRYQKMPDGACYSYNRPFSCSCQGASSSKLRINLLKMIKEAFK